MNPMWLGKIAIVTNVHSSDLFTSTVAVNLANYGMTVIAFSSRRLSKDCHLNESQKTEKGRIVPYLCDTTKEDEVKAAFEWVIWEFGGIDVLINTTTTTTKQCGSSMCMENLTNQMRNVLNENIMSPIICISEAYKSMLNRGIIGYVINISIVHKLPLSAAAATADIFDIQPALKAITNRIRAENSRIRITVTIYPYYILCPSKFGF